MTVQDKPKAEKLIINDFARGKSNGDFLDAFETFLGFLKQEKNICPWRGILRAQPHVKRFHMMYKNKKIGQIDFIDDRSNYIEITIDTVGWTGDDFDLYIEGQPDEIIDMLMERLRNTCVNCHINPTYGCSPGRNAEVAGKQYEKLCVYITLYWFDSDNMQEFTLYARRYTTTKPVGLVPLETIKKLILARKEYITKTSAK